LRLAAARSTDVIAIAAGPPAADAMLRDAVAAGAAKAIRVDAGRGRTQRDGRRGLSPRRCPADVDIVLCGDWSTDRGSGSVPAYLAAHRGAAQALGLVSLTRRRLGHHGRTPARRRSPRASAGPAPMVLSVEGASAHARRAPLEGVLRSRDATISVVHEHFEHHPAAAVRTAPYRPRARVLSPPAVPSPETASSPSPARSSTATRRNDWCSTPAKLRTGSSTNSGAGATSSNYEAIGRIPARIASGIGGRADGADAMADRPTRLDD